jgi:hypothetical protein
MSPFAVRHSSKVMRFGRAFCPDSDIFTEQTPVKIFPDAFLIIWQLCYYVIAFEMSF